MTLGQRLRERRRELDKTLKDVASAAEISIPYLSDMERDKARPPLDTLGKIATALNLTTTTLLDGIDGFGEKDEFPILPAGLQLLKDHPTLGEGIDGDWIHTLLRVDYRGRRPETMQDWYALYATLKSIYEESKKSG